MINYYSSDFKLGVLGGGQLGRMLLTETKKLDIYTAILDASPEAPCAKACNEFHLGSLMDFDAVYNFGKKVDLLTIEIEHVNVDALLQLEKEGLTIYPKPAILSIIQHKGKQKTFYAENQLPTAAFKRYSGVAPFKESVENGDFTFPFVWKAAQFGYDGTGVKIIRSIEDIATLPDVDCIAELMIPFKNELAVIVSRNQKGEVKTYPVVEMEFHPEANQVEYVICPARIEEKVAVKARDLAVKTVEAFDYVGIIAVEMFQTEDDEVLINEVAPRTHNSGHYSIEASYTSQFEQHLRSILNLPLGETRNKVSGIMVNLVGEEGFSGPVVYENMDKVLGMAGVSPHIYGKKETRPFRKMGHVTIVHEDINIAREMAAKVKQTIRVISKNK